jgi:hypothetical protein
VRLTGAAEGQIARVGEGVFLFMTGTARKCTVPA